MCVSSVSRAFGCEEGAAAGASFAHTSGDSCQHAVETALHLAAKDVLARRREIVLPAVEVKFPYDKFVKYNFSHKTVPMAPEQRYQLDSVELEQRMSEIIPDVLAKVKNRPLLIEIRVTHKVDEYKLKKIQDLNVSCLEIDLSKMPRDFSEENMETWIIEAGPHKHWVHNVAIERRREHLLSQATSRQTFSHGRFFP